MTIAKARSESSSDGEIEAENQQQVVTESEGTDPTQPSTLPLVAEVA